MRTIIILLALAIGFNHISYLIAKDTCVYTLDQESIEEAVHALIPPVDTSMLSREELPW